LVEKYEIMFYTVGSGARSSMADMAAAIPI